MPRPIEPTKKSAYYGLLAKDNPPEIEETDSEAEGTSWRRGRRGKPESDENWTPSTQNVTKQTRQIRKRSGTDHQSRDTMSNSNSDDSSSEERKSSAKKVKKCRAKKKPISSKKTKRFSRKLPLKPRFNAAQGKRISRTDDKIRASSSKSKMEKQMIYEQMFSKSTPFVIQTHMESSRESEKVKGFVGYTSILEGDAPDEETEFVSSAESQSKTGPLFEPLISTYVASAQEICVETEVESESEVEINTGPVITSYDSPVKHDSTSDSNTQEHMNHEPSFSTYYDPVHQGTVSSSNSENEESFSNEPQFSTWVRPPSKQSSVTSAESESKLPPLFEPLISTYIAPAQEIFVETEVESESEVEINTGPIITSYDSPVKHDSSSDSSTQEQMKYEPSFSTYYDPVQHGAVSSSNSANEDSFTMEPQFTTWIRPPSKRKSESSTEPESEMESINEPFISTYVAPNRKINNKVSELESSNSESYGYGKLFDGPTFTSYVTPATQAAVDSLSESEKSDTGSNSPIFSTWIRPTGKKTSDSDSNSDSSNSIRPIISTWKDPRATAKPRTRYQFTNKAVKRLEAAGKTVALKIPKFRSHNKPKERSPKPKRVRNPDQNRPRREYSCPICGKVFSKKFNRDRHVRDVHNGKPVQCAVCSTKLSSQKGWEEHQKNFHNKDHENVYCIYCGVAFNTKNARSMHLLRGCPKNPYPTV